MSIESWGTSWYDAAPSRPPRLDASEGTWWPAGRYRVPRSRLRQLLAFSARYHAREAVRLFVSDELESLLQAAASTGSAVELLSKAYIASVDPILLAERGDRDSLLLLTGRSSYSDILATDIRSLGASDALKLAKYLKKDLPWNAQEQLALKARNAALHMALVDRRELHNATVSMAKIVDSLLAVLELNRNDFWGEAAIGVVTELFDEAKTETSRVVAGKRAVATRYLASLVSGLDASARAVVLASLSGRHISSTDHEEPQECPVCHQQGWLLCGVDRGPVEYDYDEDGPPSAWVERTAYPFGFECAVCRLELEGDELQELDFPAEIELEPDTEPFETYDYEPDEDMYRGR